MTWGKGEIYYGVLGFMSFLKELRHHGGLHFHGINMEGGRMISRYTEVLLRAVTGSLGLWQGPKWKKTVGKNEYLEVTYLGFSIMITMQMTLNYSVNSRKLVRRSCKS